MQIGNVKINTPILLAPMAGVTDYSFRILCKEMGAGVVYSEFVSAHGIIRENEKTLDMIRFTKMERPIGIQIFGDAPEVMAQAARVVADKFNPDIIDINYGCPVPKITKKIALHPRTTKQSYKGDAKWEWIKELKEVVSIPVIGNGDIKKPEDIIRMFEETGCDAVMVARAALGNPWFFKEASALLNGSSLPPEGSSLPPEPSTHDRITMCRRHLDLLLESRGEHIGTNLMRKHFGWYIKGFSGAAILRQSLVTAKNRDEMTTLLNQTLSTSEVTSFASV